MGDIDPCVTERYDIAKRLGKGAYGIVWKALDKKNKKIVALKKIYDAFRNRTDAQRTFREIWYLQEFQHHPNVIKLLEVVKSRNDSDIYLVFDYMETDLHRLIKSHKLKEEWKQKYVIYQLLSALSYIHSANVIHRDLKPSNILLNNNLELKLADFGLARSLEQTEELTSDPVLTEYVATRWYRAPEILLGSKRYTKGVDIWSLGCIMGEVILGKALFPGNSTLNQMERIMASLPHPSQADIESLCTGYAAYVMERAANKPKRLLSDMIPECCDSGIELLSKLLALNPNRRITAKDGLLHPYLSSYCDKELPLDLDKSVPPLCDHTKLSVNQYRDKLYEMIKDSLSEKPPSPSRSEPSLSPAFLAKVNEKRIYVKQRNCDETPTIDERKEALLRNQFSKKQQIPPMGRKSLTPPFLSDRGKFSLGFKHPVILRGSSNTSQFSLQEDEDSETKEKPHVPKYGRRQYGNITNYSHNSSAKAALQNYNQDSAYGTIAASTFQAIKEGRW